MKRRPVAIDLFCGGGGAAMGLYQAGFDVVGVDSQPQPDYPFPFIKADAFDVDLSPYDFVWASPPCQGYSTISQGCSKSPLLINKVRRFINSYGKPYIIENVAGANKHLRDPVMLCGTMFDLPVFRHRYFESNLPIMCDLEHSHEGKSGGGVWRRGKKNMFAVYGHPSQREGSLEDWQKAMEINWLPAKTLAQAIPPAYSRYLGKQALKYMKNKITPQSNTYMISSLAFDSQRCIKEYFFRTILLK